MSSLVTVVLGQQQQYCVVSDVCCDSVLLRNKLQVGPDSSNWCVAVARRRACVAVAPTLLAMIYAEEPRPECHGLKEQRE